MFHSHPQAWDGGCPPDNTLADGAPHPFEHRQNPSYLNYQGFGGTARRPDSYATLPNIHLPSACMSTHAAQVIPRLETLYQCSPRTGDIMNDLCNDFCDMTASNRVRGQVCSLPRSRRHSIIGEHNFSDQAISSTAPVASDSRSSTMEDAGRFELMDDGSTPSESRGIRRHDAHSSMSVED